MFSILRFILIVGVIFYYSPVRQQTTETAPLASFLGQETSGASVAPADAAGRLESMWQVLPDSAKQAVVDRILTTSGLTPAETKPVDTLQPGDRHPAMAAGIGKLQR